ncbi:DedD protein [Kushneria sinocarnis]|uniref:DedD protein n=1 Tax=Kushneria sinocarnis TaxID=595502 RepID=A0A420WUY3_9GAMM|nr:SPOR domain-containing protein [Kushneria sinocarnis]RKQ97240.1 DedD protein [Kushneria sinocarnis]
MKYGKRERIVGAVIIIAVAVIVLPMLFGDPEPRDQGPSPTMTIEQPIDVQRDDVQSPESPLDERQAAQGGNQSPAPQPDSRPQQGNPQASQSSQLLPSSPGNGQSGSPADREGAPSGTAERQSAAPTEQPAGRDSSAETASQQSGSSEPQQESDDPIMNAANRGSGSGGWAVQAGSFGKADNADRLVSRLKDLGFDAYQKARNDLQTVYVGPYNSSEAGEQARTQLQQRANIKGLVVRRDEQ